MTDLNLAFILRSDAAFGRGDGVAGLVDQEVRHDDRGLPSLGGKTVKGLLVAECADILFSLSQMGHPSLCEWREAARFLFGRAGSRTGDESGLAVGDAMLPQDLRAALEQDFLQAGSSAAQSRLANEILESVTVIRRQTAVDPARGSPLRNSLRSVRLVLRETSFEAPLEFLRPPPDEARWLLAACVKALRRAGTARHRGRGQLAASLWQRGEDVTALWFAEFRREVRVCTA